MSHSLTSVRPFPLSFSSHSTRLFDPSRYPNNYTVHTLHFYGNLPIVAVLSHPTIVVVNHAAAQQDIKKLISTTLFLTPLKPQPSKSQPNTDPNHLNSPPPHLILPPRQTLSTPSPRTSSSTSSPSYLGVTKHAWRHVQRRGAASCKEKKQLMLCFAVPVHADDSCSPRLMTIQPNYTEALTKPKHTKPQHTNTSH